ncbi:MAG: hypothetical protein OHK0038_28340 [Flammeovirgaceae bacterium]
MSIFKKLFGGQTKESSQDTRADNKLDGSRGDIILNFQHSIQKSIEWTDLMNVEFAMWLPCEEDKNFTSSPIAEKWTKIYSLTKDYWSFITADILKTLKLVDEKTFRLGLPDNFQPFAFLTTDNEQIVVSLSKEKGIRLHFAETTPFKYKVTFLDNFISYCNAWKSLIELNNGQKDENLGFEEWWLLTLKTATTVEEKEPLTGVGKIVK